MSVPIIGGKADKQVCPAKLPRMELDGEVYMGCTYRDDKGEHYFYMLAGMVPAEALKVYKERHVKT